MLELDSITLIFAHFIYTSCISIFFISSFILKKFQFKGFINWIIAFSLLSLNFLILSLSRIIPINIVIVVPHLFAVWAYIEIKRGLSKFYGIKNRLFTDFIIISILAFLLVMNDSNARLRIITVSVASILVDLDIIVLLSAKGAKEKVQNKMITRIFWVAILVMVIRLLIGAQWKPEGDPFESGNSLGIISILFFITNIIAFFSLFFIVLSKIYNERNDLIKHIESISVTDELTGMRNRRGFKNVTDYEINRFSRTKKGFTFVIGDIDFFKKVNDLYGHEFGDKVLKVIANILKSNMRGGETAARWGGEEFVLLFPETGIEKAQIAVKRIKKEIQNHQFECNGDVFNKTMSFGICYSKDPTTGIEDVFKKADENLYRAKEEGRNKIVASFL